MINKAWNTTHLMDVLIYERRKRIQTQTITNYIYNKSNDNNDIISCHSIPKRPVKSNQPQNNFPIRFI